MREHREPPPWVWDNLPPEVHQRRWQNLVAWVQWLEEAYAPWVILPPCWPAHEGLLAELILFWCWHDWLMHEETDPVAGLRWHAELRRAADAWRQLSTCDHRPPGPEQEQVVAAERARRDQFVAEAMTRTKRGGR